jgi:hypothetical protein
MGEKEKTARAGTRNGQKEWYDPLLLYHKAKQKSIGGTKNE